MVASSDEAQPVDYSTAFCGTLPLQELWLAPLRQWQCECCLTTSALLPPLHMHMSALLAQVIQAVPAMLCIDICNCFAGTLWTLSRPTCRQLGPIHITRTGQYSSQHTAARRGERLVQRDECSSCGSGPCACIVLCRCLRACGHAEMLSPHHEHCPGAHLIYLCS